MISDDDDLLSRMEIITLILVSFLLFKDLHLADCLFI